MNDKVNVLAGFGLDAACACHRADCHRGEGADDRQWARRRQSFPIARLTSRARSQVTSQTTVGIADWAPKNGIKRVVTLVSDYAPGIDIEKSFSERFKAAGGEIVEQIRVPLANPDFAPFLQRVSDASRRACSCFVLAGVGSDLHEAVRRARRLR